MDRVDSVVRPTMNPRLSRFLIPVSLLGLSVGLVASAAPVAKKASSPKASKLPTAKPTAAPAAKPTAAPKASPTASGTGCTDGPPSESKCLSEGYLDSVCGKKYLLTATLDDLDALMLDDHERAGRAA